MPEIMSAEEFAYHIEHNCATSPIHINGFPDIPVASDEIVARDSAMLEKYKEAIDDLKSRLPRGFMSHDDEVYYDALSDCIQVLDSAFAEIEGGK